MASTLPRLHRLSPELYDRIVEAGFLVDEPVELVDGLLVDTTPQGVEHALLIQRLTRAFASRADLLRVQLPLAVPGGRPEPDLALADTPARAHPTSAELVVEIAVTAHREARAKLPGYADAGVAVAWLVDVPARAVEVHTEPVGREYGRCATLRPGESLSVPVAGIAPISVADLFAGMD